MPPVCIELVIVVEVLTTKEGMKVAWGRGQSCTEWGQSPRQVRSVKSWIETIPFASVLCRLFCIAWLSCVPSTWYCELSRFAWASVSGPAFHRLSFWYWAPVHCLSQKVIIVFVVTCQKVRGALLWRCFSSVFLYEFLAPNQLSKKPYYRHNFTKKWSWKLKFLNVCNFINIRAMEMLR